MGPKKILVKGLNFVNLLDDLDMGADDQALSNYLVYNFIVEGFILLSSKKAHQIQFDDILCHF